MTMQLSEIDYLNPGAQIKLLTQLGTEFQGEVIACDGSQRMILIKSHRPEQPAEVDDMHLINMDQVTNCEVIRDVDPDTDLSSKEPSIFYMDIKDLQARQKRIIQTVEAAWKKDQNSSGS